MNRTITSDDLKNLFTNKQTTTVNELLHIIKDLQATNLSFTIDNYMFSVTDLDKIEDDDNTDDVNTDNNNDECKKEK